MMDDPGREKDERRRNRNRSKRFADVPSSIVKYCECQQRQQSEMAVTSKDSEINRPRVVPPTLNEFTKWRYIGVCTKREAESFVHYLTEFRLYHQWNSLVNIKEINCLPLAVVYCSSTGRHYHWLVRTMGELMENKNTKRKEYKIRSYYIEHSGPSLPTLNELIKCYENRTYNRHGNIDVFRLS